MRLMSDILENRLLGRWGELLPRSPLQLGALHETDAELVDIGDGRLLAMTVDAVVEEVRVGLYRAPRTVGRIAAVSSLSDLAAVGADALGLLVCATLPSENRDQAQEGVAQGLREVLDPAGLFVLGGDTNEGERLALAVTAAGLVPKDSVITRVGARPGDQVFVSGPLGAGGAYAGAALLHVGNMDEAAFRPVVRLREGAALRGIASSCMDTSDGFIATIDQLARINDVGIHITTEPADLLHPLAAAARLAASLPAFPFLASYHGEFELVFTVPPERVPLLADRAAALNWKPIPVGVVEPRPGVRFGDTEIDSAKLRNAFALSGGDLDAYMRTLIAVGVD
jgi:thiamine-monophosphate kinase